MRTRLSHQRYNTHTATAICFDYQSLVEQNGYSQDTLYVTKRGKYFLHRVVNIDSGKTETIVPFSQNDADFFIQECTEQEKYWEKYYMEESAAL